MSLVDASSHRSYIISVAVQNLVIYISLLGEPHLHTQPLDRQHHHFHKFLPKAINLHPRILTLDYIAPICVFLSINEPYHLHFALLQKVDIEQNLFDAIFVYLVFDFGQKSTVFAAQSSELFLNFV